MNRSRWPLFFLVIALAGGTVFGFYRLFELRFQAGDVYPPYCSLRADPLGTKVLFDALQAVPDFDASRNFQSLDKIPDPGASVIFYAGAGTGSWQIDDVKHLESLATAGGRIIITFLPQDAASQNKGRRARDAKPKSAKKSDGDNTKEEPVDMQVTQVAKQWGFSLNYRTAASDGDFTPALTAKSMSPDIEPSISWHTALEFGNQNNTWNVLYRCEGAPVLMARKFGSGSIVIATDSYFLSNEAMRAERAPRLLTWLLGTRTRAVFDETHLGVREQPGIAALARKYHLGGLLAAIAVLAALFVWQNTAPFLPPMEEQDGSKIVTGKDSTSGFVSLLRRGIAPAGLIAVCVEEWKKSMASRPGVFTSRLGRIDAAAGGEPLAAYRSITQILAEKK